MTDRRRDALRRTRYSPFLTSALQRYRQLEVAFLNGGVDAALAHAGEPQGADERARLRHRRTRLATALALGDLAGELSFEQVTGHLSAFADEACERALAEAVRQSVPGFDGSVAGFGVLALGKHGGREVNYSSDIDPILIYDPATVPRRPRDEPQQAATRIARAFVDLLQTRDADGYVFRVDLRLRPTPEVSPPAVPVDGAIAHYEGAALTWERAAFVRARVAAGDRALGEHFLREVEPFLWRRSMDFGTLGELGRMAERIRQAQGDRITAAPGGDLKRGRGGIREAEFFVQAHQLIHGGRDLSLRSPNLLVALASLGQAGVVPAEEADALADDYRHLRTIEHRLQMVDDRQTHALPDDADALHNVACLHGVRDGEALARELQLVTHRVAALFAAMLPDSPKTSGSFDLARFGDDSAAEAVLAGWRAGTAPALRSEAAQAALKDVLPILLESFAEADEPLTTLYRFDDLVRRVPSAVNLFRLLQANRPIAGLLADTVAAAPALAESLAARPQLLDRLLDASALDPHPPMAELEADWAAELAPLDIERALARLRDRVEEERFALGVRLVAGAPPGELSRGHADVAEVAIRLHHQLVAREYEEVRGRIAGASLIVLAVGRLGGRALTHASDLDLILLHDGRPETRSDGARPQDATTYFGRLGQRLVSALTLPTAAGPLYEVDTRLRPSGAQGPLVLTVAGFELYGTQDAWVWERMALCRARVVSGSPEGQARAVEALIRVRAPRDDAAEVRAKALAMRGQMAEAKPAGGPLDVKLLPGGLVDLEFLVHVEQLTSADGGSPVLDEALGGLIAAGRLSPDLAPAARLLADALFVLRLTAPDGELRSFAAERLTCAACEVADRTALDAALLRARRAVVSQWRASFGVDREGWSG